MKNTIFSKIINSLDRNESYKNYINTILSNLKIKSLFCLIV